MLTARGEERTVVRGLTGRDIKLTKPFSPREFVPVSKRCFFSAAPTAGERRACSDRGLMIDPSSYRVDA